MIAFFVSLFSGPRCKSSTGGQAICCQDTYAYGSICQFHFFLQKRRPLQSQDHCAKVISMIITIPSFSIVIQKFCSHFYIAWDDKEKQQIYVCKYSVFSQTLLTPICILSAACVAFTDCICRAVGHAQLRYLSCRGAREWLFGRCPLCLPSMTLEPKCFQLI